jgi:hypothetical protein
MNDGLDCVPFFLPGLGKQLPSVIYIYIICSLSLLNLTLGFAAGARQRVGLDHRFSGFIYYGLDRRSCAPFLFNLFALVTY